MKSKGADTYWLASWLASRRINSRADAIREINKPGVLKELEAIATNWTGKDQAISSGYNLAPGTGLRLNDRLTCPSAKCRIRQVDVLFRHAWHYYDSLLLPDGSAELLLGNHEVRSRAKLKKLLLNQIEVVMHLQEINAIPLVHFYRNAELFEPVLESAPHLSGMIGSCRDTAWESVEAEIRNPDLYDFHEAADGSLEVTCYDPGGESCKTIVFDKKTVKRRTKKWIIDAAAHDVLHFHIAALERDMRASRYFAAPLASTFWSHTSALSAINGGPETSNILFELQFPSLSHVPISDLLSMRANEGDSFIALRSALTRAARTMLAEKTSEDPKAIAESIRMDIVEPELARLTLKFKSAQRAMRKKTLISIALTTVTTMCGLAVEGITGAAGGAALGLVTSGTLATASKFCDTEAEIQASDMFFLWKALGHAE